MLWKSPKYKFRVPKGDEGDGLLKEIAIDLTGSAPTFVIPSQRMCAALDRSIALLAHLSRPRIIDIGAGKLRTTLYILQKTSQSRLWAVEYEQLRSISKQAQEMYSLAESYKKRFKPVLFPHEFIRLRERFDLAVVANVLGTMPIPAERLFLLQHCHEKLKNNGLLLWYSQHNEADYAEGGTRCNGTTRLGDGYHVGNDKYRTFYRDIQPEEVDQLLLCAGFQFEESIPAGHNIARIYKKAGTNLFSPVLFRKQIEAICGRHSAISDPTNPEIKIIKATNRLRPVLPDPEEFSLEELCIRRLQGLGVGAHYATAFHRLTELILRRVFQHSLRTFVIEQEINEGTKRVDIVAKNFDENGFFRRLDAHYHVPCPNIFIECKNYNSDPTNPELDQIASRLLPIRGMFGFLIYRHCADRTRLRKRCKQFVREHKYIVDLDDADLIKLLRLRRQDEPAQINDILEARLDLLTLQPE